MSGTAQKVVDNLCAAVELTHAAIAEFESLVKANIEDEAILSCCEKFTKLSSRYVESIEDLGSVFKVYLDWIPPSYTISDVDHSINFDERYGVDETEYQYADGYTPWGFWLMRESDADFEAFTSNMQKTYKNGVLSKVSSLPEVGTVVICVDRNVVFRAVITKTFDDKARVRSVDEPFEKLIKLDNIYFMPKMMNYVRSRSVLCCLTKDCSFKNLWNADLCGLFKNTMKECALQVKFVELIPDTFPPMFLIEMVGFGECAVNFNQWISKIFKSISNYKRAEDVKLETLPECVFNPYYQANDSIPKERSTKTDSKTNDGKQCKKVHFDESSDMYTGEDSEISSCVAQVAWSPQLIMHPNHLLTTYYVGNNPVTVSPSLYALSQGLKKQHQAIATQYTATAVYSGLDTNANLYQIPHQITTTTSSIIVKQTPLAQNSLLNVNTPVFEPKNMITSQSGNQENLALSLNKDEPSASTLVHTESEICPIFNKNGFCINSACNKRHIQLKKGCLKDQNTSDFKDSPASNQNIKISTSRIPNDVSVPHCNVIDPPFDSCQKQYTETKSQNEELYDEDDDDDDDLEEPCINGGYVPTDETRLCRFFVKNGHCWKQQCPKEHSMTVKYKWTNDTQPAVDNTFNLLVLPEIGETIELLVTKVKSPYTFYARLPDVYSDIGEGVENIETFSSLHKSMNDPKNSKKYSFPPNTVAAEGEFYLVKSNDNYWKRARIIDSSEKLIRVFYVDYGDEEDVSKQALKTIENRFLHLPCQAVLCLLSDLYCGSDDINLKINGRKHLEGLIQGKVISGKVVSRSVEETSLDLMVICDELNINNVMVARGFCEQV